MKEKNSVSTTLSWLFTIRHYYGDTVRQLFLLGAIALFILVPFLSMRNFTGAISIVFMAIVLALFAGLTNPRHRWVALADAVIAGLGCLFFELVAMGMYTATGDITQPFFIAFQLLALDFLFAFYFSIKTIRSMNIAEENSVE